MEQAVEAKYYRQALLLGFVTFGYNLIEGIVSVYFGLQDETLALFGFGVDSFIETLSAAGIIHMIWRIGRAEDASNRDQFERTALRITGIAFYLLAAGLSVNIVINVVNQHAPVTTVWGTVIGSLSIATMWLLIYFKKRVGYRLNSDPILADANCTKVCLYMSVILLASSLIYEYTGFIYADSIGAAGLVYFSFTEGRESFKKAKGKACGDCC